MGYWPSWFSQDGWLLAKFFFYRLKSVELRSINTQKQEQNQYPAILTESAWSIKDLLKVKNDHRSKFSNLSNWKEEAWKKSGLQRDSNPWPPRYWCDALPTELWSYTLGARPLNWVHIFPWGVKWCEVYMK